MATPMIQVSAARPAGSQLLQLKNYLQQATALATILVAEGTAILSGTGGYAELATQWGVAANATETTTAAQNAQTVAGNLSTLLTELNSAAAVIGLRDQVVPQ